MEEKIYNYRLKFSKNGPVRFVGHLDVMRYLQKANRRAELPVRYSEGFSPHQIMSIALPLPVGATSDGEYLDMSFVSMMEPDEIVTRLNSVMHEGIEARGCLLLEEHAPKSMTIISGAGYRLSLNHPVDRASFDGFMAQESIITVKKTKKKEQEIDIKPLIHRYEVGDDGTLIVLLHAGSVDHLKPSLLIDCYSTYLGGGQESEGLRVHRLDLYSSESGPDGGLLFCPLIGSEKIAADRF